jgi:hypothetical protein
MNKAPETAAQPAARPTGRPQALGQSPKRAEDAPAEAGALTRIAEAELQRRRAALASAVDSGKVSAAAANDNARLWLAIAAKAGAILPELELHTIFPLGGKTLLRWFDIADAPELLAELARARDIALASSIAHPDDLARQQRAWDLQGLAIHLGAPPPTPDTLRPPEQPERTAA